MSLCGEEGDSENLQEGLLKSYPGRAEKLPPACRTYWDDGKTGDLAQWHSWLSTWILPLKTTSHFYTKSVCVYAYIVRYSNTIACLDCAAAATLPSLVSTLEKACVFCIWDTPCSSWGRSLDGMQQRPLSLPLWNLAGFIPYNCLWFASNSARKWKSFGFPLCF